MANLFGWTSLIVLLVIICIYVKGYSRVIISFFKSVYEPDGRDMNISLKELEDYCGYVPEVETELAPYPFIVGDIKDMDDELFDWLSDEHPCDYYNVTLDLQDILSPTEL